MRGLVVVVVIAGCGRIGFDRGGTGVTGDGTAADPDALGCALPTVRSFYLKAWYPTQDLGPGTVARDASGYNNDGSCSGSNTCPTITTGRTCSAYRFDGVDDRIDVPDSPTIRPGAAGFTVAAWVLLEQAPALRACAVAKGYSTMFNNTWTICIESDLRVHFYTIDTTQTPHIQNTTATITLGQWHHVAVEWNTSRKVTYVDGVALASDVVLDVDFDGNAFHIGADVDAGSTSQQWTGKVADVRIYDEALLDVDVAALAQ